ncbi:MAG: dynamin family protein [Lachnospiraceae bacterium]|nr:dynamin family protein [Lachnospiraceae bacterium]
MESYIRIMDELCSLTDELKNERLRTLAGFLDQRINNPDTYLVFLGESCSGKSTLINSIIRKKVLPVSAIPSTGAITEIDLSGGSDEEAFFAINKDATMEELNEDIFQTLALRPDDKLERLRYSTCIADKGYSGVRIFDTPGYGSLIRKHEEVLVNFLPNADAIVYVVSYINGFQEADYEFLKGLLDLTREGVPFYLLVNRCPPATTADDRRVQEIYSYVISLLQKPVIPLTVIESFGENEEEVIQTAMSSFVKDIMLYLNSEEERSKLKDVFREYIVELIEFIEAEVERLIRNKELSEEEKRGQDALLNDFLGRLDKAEEVIIRPGFKKILDKFPSRLEECRKRIEDNTVSVIDTQDKASKEETIAYINHHVLNRNTGREVSELQFFLVNELDIIDNKLNDYLNKAIIQFEKDLKLNSPGAVYQTGMRIAKDAGAKFLNMGLLNYFAAFGGAGGAAAGVANAASHALKQVGDLFGKTFSLGTHNALKHSMKTIGLTSVKTLAVSAVVITELAFITVDYNTWKGKLKKQVSKVTKEWAEEILKVTNEELRKSEEINIENIKEINKLFRQRFSTEEETEEFTPEYLNNKMRRLGELKGEAVYGQGF